MKGFSPISSKILTPKQKAKIIAEFASDKKATDITILDMRSSVNFCDYFVICSGNTERQVKAVADYIEEEIEKKGEKLTSQQGSKKADWIILDYGDVVVHVFDKDKRDFYRLEHLWHDAKRSVFKEKPARKKKS